MITLQMMQFTAVVLMVLLTAKLLFLRERRIKSRQARQARWLMTTATALLALHFAIQLKTGLRLMGITQSVMLNLAMLIPASHLFSRAILLLQRHGELSLADRWAGPAVWMLTMAMLAVAALTDGQPLLSDTPELRMAEKAGAVLYMLMQGYYTWRHSSSLVAMRRALSDYYDRDTDGMLRWMQYSIIGLMLLALMVPMAIFGTGTWMLIIAFAVYFFLFYLVDSFCFYLVSPAPERIQAAEQNATEVKEEACREQAAMSSHKGTEEGTDAALLSPEVTHEVEQAVAAWLARGGYRQTGLLQPQAAQDIGISRYRLTTWLHQQGLKYTEWIAQLRVEEAKRTIAAHPDWGNDTVAQHCGFADRTVLQRTFKKIEGITPQKYMENLSD
jgi:AraC-like DNA-binding protein